MKLEQGQVWKTSPAVHGHGENSLFLRIVQLERLAVEYKEMANLLSKDGKHKTATKKEFCRLIKGATLSDYK
ncbi:MAG: hypothetical protein NWT02_07640 [Opitutales bacterium]|jgi:hypothetical protein|nr:hypothetical protein [Opitutales bacterium]